MVQYPWYPEIRLVYIVPVEVRRFEAGTNKAARLIAHWGLTTPQHDPAVASRTTQISYPLGSVAGDTIAAALSMAEAEFAAQITPTIAQAEQRPLVFSDDKK